MYTESSGVIHPTVTSRSKSENHGHGGVWVCHKCGWTYPNPHPSAKHRRNHKKHCGKIEGFNLISRPTGDSEERTITHSHSDDDYDDELMALPSQDHHKPPLPGPAPLQVAHDSSSSPVFDAKAPAVTETQGGALGHSGSSEEQQVFSDAVPYFSDTDLLIITATSTSAVPIVTDISRESQGTIIDHMHLGSLAADIGRESQESSDMTCDDQVQNPHTSQITADHALQFAADTSKKTKSLPAELTEDRSTSALEHEQTSISGSTMHSRTNDTGENMINCSRTVVGPVLDAMGGGNNCVDGGNLPTGPMLIQSDMDGSGIDPELHRHQRVADVEIFHSLADAELHKHHGVAQVDVLPSTIASDTSLTTTKDACLINDTVTSFGELGDSTVCCADEKQPDALDQKSYHYDPSLKASNLEAIVVAVGEGNTRFPDVIHEFDSIGEEHVSEYGIEETDTIKSCTAHGIAGENMINCSRTVVGPVLDAIGDGNNCVGGNLPTGPMLIESDVDGSGIDPELHKHQRVAHVEIFHLLADAELHKHHEVAQVDVLPSTIASDTSLTTTKDAWLINDTVTSFGELGDSTVCRADEKQLDALEQKSYLEAIVVAVGEDNTRFPDVIHEFDSIGDEHVSEYGIDETNKITSCSAHGIAGKNPPTISMLEPMELRVPITSAGDYAVEKTEGCIQDSNEMSAMISYLQLAGSEHLSSGSEINPNLSKGEAIVANHDGAALGLTEMDGSPSPSQKNVLDCSFGGWEESGSHETLTAPVAIDSKVVDNSDLDGKILAATLGDAVLCLTEIVAAPSSSQENRSNYSFAGQETCESRFSHETLMTPVALDSKVELKSIALTEVHFTDTGGDYNQDGATYEDSLVNPKLCTSESTNIASEEVTKPPCHADTASDEFVTPSNITNNAAFLDAVVIDSNGMGTNSNNQLGEVPECSSKQQIHQNEVLQENRQLSVSILEDHPVVNTEDEFEMENRDQHQGSSLIHASVLVVDALGDSISQADSMEGYWGSVSEGTVPSELLSTPVMEALAYNEAQFTTAEAGTGASLKHLNDTVEIFEAPSFITLVQPSNQSVSAEIEPQNPPCPPVQAGWFPSQAHAAKESEGRKRNEEMMAKVVNWASSGKPHASHTPLRNLLVEANLESKLHKKMMPPQSATRGEEQHSRQYEKSSETSIENKNKNLPPPLPVKLLHYDPPAAAARKEWNSPARFPDAKREKRKGRRKPYWVTFACCSSSIN